MKKLISRTLILGALVGCMATAAWAGNVDVGPDGEGVQRAAEGYYITKEVHPTGTTEIKDVRFDKNGNVMEKTVATADEDEITYKYAYDANGNVLRETTKNGVNKYEYDSEGRLIKCGNQQRFYGEHSVSVSTFSSGPYADATVAYELDDNGNVIKRSSTFYMDNSYMPFGDRPYYTYTVLYTYDTAGNLVLAEENISSRYFDEYDGMVTVERKGSTVTYEYENGLCTKITTVTSEGEETSSTYEYDSNGNMVKSVDSDGKIDTYEYAPIPGPAASKFSDVQEVAQYYYDPVIWATDKKITDGTGDGNFTPGGNCTRAQMVTFLWRAAGSPEPKNAENPFEDVPNDTWYTKAVQWAVENGITTGASDTKFDPNGKCTRAQIVTFLWRAAGQQQPETDENPFEDVASDAYYKNAVLWAVENGITTGTAATKFAPKGICTRGQGVTFLYRAADLLG